MVDILTLLMATVSAVLSGICLYELRVKNRTASEEPKPETDPSQILREWLIGGDS